MKGAALIDPNQPWYSTRIDEAWGEIRYEAFGPKGSFVRFQGSNARHDCKAFMEAVGGAFMESNEIEGGVSDDK